MGNPSPKVSFTSNYAKLLEFHVSGCGLYVHGRPKKSASGGQTKYFLKAELPGFTLTHEFRNIDDKFISGPPFLVSPEGSKYKWQVLDGQGVKEEFSFNTKSDSDKCRIIKPSVAKMSPIFFEPTYGPLLPKGLSIVEQLVSEANKVYLKRKLNAFWWFPSDQFSNGDTMFAPNMNIIIFAGSGKYQLQMRNTIFHELAHALFFGLSKEMREELMKADGEIRPEAKKLFKYFQEGSYGVSVSHGIDGLDQYELFANAAVILRYHFDKFIKDTKKPPPKIRAKVYSYASAVIKAYGKFKLIGDKSI